jgi:hypothetical protein
MADVLTVIKLELQSKTQKIFGVPVITPEEDNKEE